MKRMRSLFLRNASKTPLIPSPGIPKIVSTPHAISRSTRTSDAFIDSLLAFGWKVQSEQGVVGRDDTAAGVQARPAPLGAMPQHLTEGGVNIHAQKRTRAEAGRPEAP